MQLSSAYQSLAATGGDPGSVPSVTTDTSAARGRFAVSVAPLLTTFFSSLSPAYGLDNKRQMSKFVESLPESPKLQVKVGELAQKIKFACNILSRWTPSVRVITDAVAILCSSHSLAEEFGQALAGKRENKRSSTSASVSVPAGAALTLVTLNNLAGAAAVPATGERGSSQDPILVHNSETLGKIGQDKNYPPDAYYLQNDSFSHEIKKPGAVFSGHYDGGCHTISGLKTCLFSDIGRHGVVRNLRLVNITIDDSLPAQGVLACTMAPFSTARDIQVERAKVINRANGKANDRAATGALVGHQHHSALIIGADLRDCDVDSRGNYTATGAVGGRIDGQLRVVNVSACQVGSFGIGSPTGIGAGLLKGQIKDLVVNGSYSFAVAPEADAGIGAGMAMANSSLERMSVIDSGAIAQARDGSAGIGGGRVNGELDQLTVVNSTVLTSGTRGFAGIGGGQVGNQSLISNMFCVNSRVETVGEEASAGVITGRLSGKAREITSERCVVITLGDSAETGVGVGINTGEIRNFTTVNSEARNNDSSSGLEAGDNNGTIQGIASLHTLVDRQWRTVNPPALSGLCAGADPRFVASDCSIPRLGEFSWQCSSPGNQSLVPISVQPLAVTTPTMMVAGLSAGTMAVIVVSATSFIIGAGIVACCCYHSRHQTEESQEDSDYYDGL